MTSTQPTCPPPEALTDLLANALPAAEADKLRAHIADCPRCRAALGPRPGAAGPHTPPDSEPAAAGRPPGYLEFLDPPRGPGEVGRLGHYRILGLLGEGGMAYVFDAEDTRLLRPVALKVLKAGADDPTRRQRLLDEARAVAALPHEHIITIYYVGEIRDVVYIALERLRGASLEQRLRRERWLPVAEALAVARQVAEGLAVAHDKGLVHGDVKPDNIWLEGPGPDGPFTNVKVIDFGVARLAVGPSPFAAPGQIVGTPEYMAPEQARGLPADQRADLYALGCVLYRMLTGRAPFDAAGPDTRALLTAIIRDEPVAVQELAPRLPPAVARLINDLLAKNPADRPANAREVIARLRAAEGGETVPAAAAPALVAAAGPAPPRAMNWGVWAGAATVLLAALAVLAFGLARYLSPSGPADQGGGGGTFAGQEPIKVGVLHSLTGTLSLSERPVVEATELAIDEINDAGGVLGRPLQPVVEDGESDPDVFAGRARKLLAEDKVAVISGCWSSAARKRVAAVCEARGGLLLYPVPSEGLEESPAVFYLGGSPNQILLPMADYATEELKKARFFLVGSETVYSKASHAILKDHLLRTPGVAVVGEECLPLGVTDFADLVRQVRASKADMILNTMDGQSNLALAQALRARAADLDPDRVPAVWFRVSEHELHYLRPEQLAGDYTCWSYFEDVARDDNREFVDRYRKRFGQTRSVNDPMMTAYTGIYLWKQAVEQAGTLGPKEVRAALRDQARDAPGGEVRLDPATQHAWRFSRVGQIEAGRTIKVVKSSPAVLPPRPFPASRTPEQWQGFLADLYRDWGDHWEKHAR
jgi:urea transport system substrate-binding protein